MTDKKQEPLPCRIKDGFCAEHKSGQVDQPQDYCEEAMIRGWVKRTPTPSREDLARAEVLEFVAGIFEREVGEGTMPERMRQFAASLRQNSELPPFKSEDEVRAEARREAFRDAGQAMLGGLATVSLGHEATELVRKIANRYIEFGNWMERRE